MGGSKQARANRNAEKRRQKSKRRTRRQDGETIDVTIEDLYGYLGGECGDEMEMTPLFDLQDGWELYVCTGKLEDCLAEMVGLGLIVGNAKEKVLEMWSKVV